MCSCLSSPPPLSLTHGSSAHTHDGEIEKEISRPQNKNDGRMSGNETAARSTRERGETGIERVARETKKNEKKRGTAGGTSAE